MPCAACHCKILHDMHLAVRMSRLFLYSLKKKRELEYMKLVKGAQSIAYDRAPYLISSASVVGKKEGEGPIGEMFDLVGESDSFGENTWEEAESTMQREACLLAMGKAHVSQNQVRYLFGGDLLRQGIATSMGVEKLQIPMFGLYGACSTSGEALALASMSVAAGYLQSFWKCGKRISFSTKLCESKTIVCPLDCDWKWSVSCGEKGEPCEDKWSDSGKNCGLRSERFAEHGSVYGAGGL